MQGFCNKKWSWQLSIVRNAIVYLHQDNGPNKGMEKSILDGKYKERRIFLARKHEAKLILLQSICIVFQSVYLSTDS